MKFFLDTANLEQIRQGAALGIIDGVTTNPSLMAKEGIMGEEAIRRHYIEICNIVDGDISAEVLSTTYQQMVEEGAQLAALHSNIVVKVPCTADGLKAIKYFADNDIRTNCTLVFTLGQALLAAKAGASYVSPFVGRLDDIGSDGMALVAQIVRTFAMYDIYSCEVLAASIRHTRHITECLEVGAHVATCPLSAILGLLKHPLTDSGLAQFIKDTDKMLLR